MRIEANCKINIGLDVVERRADGFHELSTVMFPVVGLFDSLHFEVIDTQQVEFISKGIEIDCSPDDNLCIKAYNLMLKEYGHLIKKGVRITLEKNIPFGAGLGGGSSDATAVIKAINHLFKLALDEKQLIELAAKLGSDTPFFVRNTPQLCSGRGEIMENFNIDLSGKYLILIKPKEGVSTREAYSGVKPSRPTTPLSELLKLPVEQWQGRVKNDFEPHIFRSHPLLKDIKDKLLEVGALYAAMSGSGSTIYGIFENFSDKESEQLKSHSPYIFKL